MKEKFKTRNDVFDEHTNRLLFELASKGHFEEDTLSPISIGKEANIFSAQKGSKKIIIKIYRVNTADFHRMFQLLRRDPRFPNLANKRRKVVSAWAQREFKNLHRARDAGVKVPAPYELKENILLMEFIGKKEPSPKLKDLYPSSEKFLNNVILNMKKLLKAKLIHGDLSAFNILNLNDKPVFIDFSQAMETNTQYAREMFDRDVRNIATFFNKIGMETTEDYIKQKLLPKTKK